MFDVYGADAWYERPIEEFVPDGHDSAPNAAAPNSSAKCNILDVWFDSGSSHEAVLPFREDHHWPADIYLEGSDQHRGWFHSSLLVGIGTRGRAPFNQVLTHGFVMDEQGRKMSKSLGNTTAPQDVIKQSGSEILRLWVTMVDYRYDINLGKEVLARDGRELSQVPQRDPRAGRQPLRLRSEGRCRAEGEDAGDRSLGARASTPTPRRRWSRPTMTTTIRRSSRSRTS